MQQRLKRARLRGQPPRRPWRKLIPPIRDRREVALVAGSLAAVILLLALTAVFMRSLPDTSTALTYAPHAIQIYDRFNKLVATVEGDEERDFIPINQIPEHVQQAVIAAEDHTFYTNKGVSPRGIVRALFADLAAGRIVEGGSTITQQLAKNLFLSSDRSLLRKMREAIIAFQLDRQYSKKQIMEMYLNQVYFGRGCYGIERASLRYFGKSARDLNLSQAAFLAGIIRQPGYLGDPRNVTEARARQKVVLDSMVQLGFVMPAEATKAENAHLAFMSSPSRLANYAYYINAVKAFLASQLSESRIEEGGLRVYTNMDPVAQSLAERTLWHDVRTAPRAMNQAALVSVKVNDGGVVAIVGGTGNYWQHQWNSAIHEHELGSAFKPFVYLTTFLEHKLTPDSLIDDDPISVPERGMPDWSPRNFDNTYMGMIPVRLALGLSRNVCAVRAALMVGLDDVINTARLAGITSPLPKSWSLSLGVASVSPIEIAGAYATFARDGQYMPASIVRRIEGQEHFVRTYQSTPNRVFPSEPVRELVSCMQTVVQQGTGAAAALGDRPVAGKTGTTDGAKDLWFVGYTPDMVTAVWGANDQHKSLGGLTGGVALAGIWRDYNRAYYRARPTPPGAFLPMQEEAVPQPAPDWRQQEDQNNRDQTNNNQQEQQPQTEEDRRRAEEQPRSEEQQPWTEEQQPRSEQQQPQEEQPRRERVPQIQEYGQGAGPYYAPMPAPAPPRETRPREIAPYPVPAPDYAPGPPPGYGWRPAPWVQRRAIPQDQQPPDAGDSSGDSDQ